MYAFMIGYSALTTLNIRSVLGVCIYVRLVSVMANLIIIFRTQLKYFYLLEDALAQMKIASFSV